MESRLCAEGAMPAIGLRSDWDAGGVRAAARMADDADQVRRLLALAAVYEGKSRAAAARVGVMDRQTLRDWVHRFNAEGAAGLVNRKAPGARRQLSAEQEVPFAPLIAPGPHRHPHGRVPRRSRHLPH